MSSRLTTTLSIIAIALIASASAYLSRETLAGFIVGKSQTNLEADINSGLVGYWTFDGADVNATQVLDKSGNGNTGTRNGGVKPEMGKIGQGMSFDGVNGYLQSTTLNKTSIGTNLTISLWVKPSGAQTTRGIFQLAGNLGDTSPWILFQRTDASTVRWYLNGDYQITINNADNEWAHMLITYDGVVWKSYKNGNFAGSYTGGIGGYGGEYFYLGNGYNGYYAGSTDDVRVYNRILSAKEIKQLYAMGESKISSSQDNLEVDINSGLVGYWTFDGADWSSSVTTTDKSNTAEHLGIFGGAKKEVGKIGQGIYFDGVSGRGATEVTSNTGYFTLSAWVYPEIVDGYYTIIAKNDASGGPPYLIRTSSGGIVNFYTGDLADSSTDSTTALPLNQWTHVAGIYDGRNRDLYINGVLNKHETTTGSVVINSTRPISIGTWTSGVSTWIQFWKGKLDDVRVYDRALSANEIYQLYMMGR